MSIPVMPATSVANKHELDRTYPNWVRDDHFQYIGRKRDGMHYGNPFSARPMSLAEVKVAGHAESIKCFEDWFYRRDSGLFMIEPKRLEWIHATLHQHQGKTLVCFCHPKPCHGHTYQRYLDGR